MDFQIKHWRGYARRFPSVLPLASANFVPRKDHWVHHTFGTCNFSVIVRGRGRFERFGRTWEVVAPCVITQLPGERVDYGPDLPAHTWDELYLIYDAELRPRLEAAGFIDPERPVWPIHDLARVRALVAEFAEIANSPAPERVVDRADRLAERILLETLLAPAPEAAAPAAARDPLAQILAALRRDFARPVDLDALAARHGMARATFRRRWAELVPQPPARYLQGLRMREACRLLAETSRPVHEVARAVGFEDEFYFSRRFHREHGLPPRQYRKIYALRVRGAETPAP